MMKINRTSRFKKEYRQMMKRGYNSKLFEFVVGEIANGRLLDPKYKGSYSKKFKLLMK